MKNFLKSVGSYIASLLLSVILAVELVILSVVAIVFSPILAVFIAQEIFESPVDERSKEHNCVELNLDNKKECYAE